jgi:hypothetical protein
MTSTQTPPPAPATAAPAPRQGNGFGITALILGICGFVLGLIPFVGFGSWFLGLLAVIFGGIGLTRKFRPKGSSIAGLVVGAIALITSLVFAFMYTASLAAAVSSSLKTAGTGAYGSGTHTIVYEVTGTGSATVDYFTMQGSKSVSKSATETLPFTKTVKFTQSDAFDFNAFSVTATSKSSKDTAKATCSLTVDGKVKATDTATGPFATVSCFG